jgi:hypothetical protein
LTARVDDKVERPNLDGIAFDGFEFEFAMTAADTQQDFCSKSHSKHQPIKVVTERIFPSSIRTQQDFCSKLRSKSTNASRLLRNEVQRCDEPPHCPNL